MQCARCNADNPPAARFCGACGCALAPACPQCGAALREGQRFCTTCGHDLAAPVKRIAPDEGERRHATVMFSDLSGYTALNESCDPEEVEALLSRIKAEATTLIERHGGTVNQFVGDEIMALFGVPLARRDDPRHAVSAALELHPVIDRLVAEFGPRLGSSATPLTLHTGINTGLVVARRSDKRAGDYALTGDAVNIAARLRSVAKPGEIVVSADTWQQVSAYFEADAGLPVDVKGKERPLLCYRILAERPAPEADAGPLIGRDEEQHQFAAFARACAARKRGRVIVVRGDPGVGKSRLVAEFAGQAQALGFSCHSAAVLDFGAETGRDAVRSLVRSLLGVAGNAEEARRREAVERLSARERIEPDQQLFLYDLIDAAPPAPLRALAAAMNTAAREKGSLRALCDLARTSSAAAPLLLLAEDIHWADDWTLERLAALAAVAAKHPLLLLMTTRFAGDPSAGAWRTALHGAPLAGIDLGPLSAEDSMRLAVAASAMSSALLGSCVERAEGNPLFLLQLLLNVGGVAQASLPGSIQALVHARMDRLAAEDKTALQAAAVLGQRYSLDALRHVLDNASYQCRLLVEQFLVRSDGDEFLFCHALIRDGAYASLLHTRRRRFHARAAEWFEPNDPVLAAEHFDRAEDPRAALAHLRASQALSAQFRYPAALALAEHGLQLAAEREARFSLLLARAKLLVELGRTGDAIDACRATLEAAEGAAERALALIGLAAAMRLNDRIDEGLAALDEAEPLAAGAGLASELSRLHHLRGNLLFPTGRHAQCLSEHERARVLAREAGSLEGEVAALGGLGDAYYLQGRMRSANAQFTECVALARRHAFGRLEVANLSMIGWSAVHLLDIAGALAVGIEAIALAERAAQPRAELLARTLVSHLHGMVRDDRAAAEQQTDEVFRLLRTLGAKRFEAQHLGVLAIVALRRGERAAARDLAWQALAICREIGMGHTGPMTLGICASIETDADARRRLLAEGEAQLAQGSASHNYIWLRDLGIDASLQIGDWDGAEGYCTRLHEYTAAEPLPFADFLIDRGRALARFGRAERSVDLQRVLARLRDVAVTAELNAALPALARALEDFDAEAAAQGRRPPPSPSG